MDEAEKRQLNLRVANLVAERDELIKYLERAEIAIGKLVIRVAELESATYASFRVVVPDQTKENDSNG